MHHLILKLILFATALAPHSILWGLGSEKPAEFALKDRVVLIQPIVIQSEDKSKRLPWVLPEQELDQEFNSKGIDIHFVEAVFSSNDAATTGKIAPKKIIKQLSSNRKIRRADIAPHLIFVQALKNKKALKIVRSDEGAFIFVSLSAKDSSVTESVSKGLNTLLKTKKDQPSSFTHPRVRCLNGEAAKKDFLDEAHEIFFSQLMQREMTCFTKEKLSHPDDLPASRRETLERFEKGVLDFTEDETQAITWMASEVDKAIGETYPLFTQQPWRFIKSAKHLCGGFAYTRGYSIILSEGMINHVVSNFKNNKDKPNPGLANLFAHEKIHVLQRIHYRKFVRAGLAMGFLRGTLPSIPWVTQIKVSNPDALDLSWVIQAKDPKTNKLAIFWPRPTINEKAGEVPVMGRDFKDIAVRLVLEKEKVATYKAVLNDDGTPSYVLLDELKDHIDKHPIRVGVDHPNEVVAYDFGLLLMMDHLKMNLPPHFKKESLNTFREWCKKEMHSTELK